MRTSGYQIIRVSVSVEIIAKTTGGVYGIVVMRTSYMYKHVNTEHCLFEQVANVIQGSHFQTKTPIVL